MPDQHPVHSRLAGGRPLTGIGSANADMQRASGSKNPGVDAATAGLPPEMQDEALRAEVEKSERIAAQRTELAQVLAGGDWRIPGDTRPVGPQTETVQDAPDDMIAYWHGEYRAALEKQTLDAVEDENTRMGALFTIGPDHPDYNAIQDRERRKRIEKGLVPLDFAQYMLRGYVDQVVETRPDFSIVLRSLTTRQGLWMERLARERFEKLSQMEANHLYGVWQVATSLQAYIIKGRKTEATPSLSVYSKETQYDEFVKALDARVEALADKPLELLQDFVAQYIWFSGRVRLLCSGDVVSRLGNS